MKRDPGLSDIEVKKIDTENNDEFPTIVAKITLPFTFSKRVIINTYYTKNDEARGATITVNSSIMNE